MEENQIQEKYINRWKKQNPQYFKEYRKLNKQKMDAYHTAWVAKNKEWVKKYQRERLQRIKNEPPKIEPLDETVETVVNVDNKTKPILSKTKLKQIRIGKELDKLKKKAELFKASLQLIN
jgi:hypothetical protein